MKKLISNLQSQLKKIKMIMCFYKPKTWEEFINLRSHKFKMRELNKEFNEIIYHPDNIKFFLIDNELITTNNNFNK